MAAEQPESQDPSQTPEGPAPAPQNRKERRANAVIKRRTKRKEVVEELQQPDQFQQQGRPVVEWVLEHTNQIGIAIAVILVGLFAWGIMDSMKASSHKEAAEALYKARRELPALAALPTDDADDNEAKLGTALTALEAVIADHDGTPQADEARVDAAGAAYRLGDYDKALGLYEAAAKGSGVTATMARIGKAYALESKGDLAGASAAFEAVRSSTLGGMKAQATLDLARVAAASGDTDKAKSLLGSFEADFPDSLLLPEAQTRLAALD